MLLKKLPEKLGDPKKFLIPCDFPGMDVCHAMPLSIWKKISLPELTPTRMTLELADQSITRPKGVAEDVFVKVGMFHFSTNFVVVDFEADPRVPLILGISFLRTGRALVDVYREEITLRVNDEAVTFNLNQTMRYSSTYNDLSGSDFILEEIEAYLKDESISPKIDHADSREVVKAKSSIEEPPKLELKDLPSHLEYAYLEGLDNLPVIIAKDLKDNKNEALLKVLKSHKRAIAWKITDIKGIDPRFFTHKILMEEDYKPAVQSQRRVNPKIHEVIKKEVIKLLDAEIIYPISDSSWVSPIHCVPKNFGITVVENENNELIPTRFIQDFTKIARPMTHLLEKETPFVFSKYCIDAFETLKKKLTEASILIVPDWNLPFELMCDASDFAIGAVLGQQMLAVVYAFEKFRPYFVLSKSIVYTDHSALKYLLSKQDSKPRLIRWVLLLQEINIIIRDKKGTENLTADHLSRRENPHKDVFENKDINENFPLETLGKISSRSTSWFVDFANFHAGNFIVKGMRPSKRRNSLRMLNITSGMIPTFFGYVWIKSFDGVCMAKKLMIFSKLVMKDPPGAIMVSISSPRKVIISDRMTHFCIDKFAKVISKYGVTHRLATAYHPQTSGQVEVSNRGLKHILERTVRENRASWSEKLKDALWAFRTAYKTPIRCTPYKLVYGKSCHLPIELEHKAYWALKHANFDLKTTGDHRKLQLNELNELRDQASENYLIYKEKTKKLHDSEIKNRIFNVGNRVLLFNSRLKIFSRKLKTRWSRPFTITKVFPYGTVELSQPDGPNFKVNGHRVKHYFVGDVP
nr:hypothetical protein [Tanacetum cinerariifolium]